MRKFLAIFFLAAAGLSLVNEAAPASLVPESQKSSVLIPGTNGNDIKITVLDGKQSTTQLKSRKQQEFNFEPFMQVLQGIPDCNGDVPNEEDLDRIVSYLMGLAEQYPEGDPQADYGYMTKAFCALTKFYAISDFLIQQTESLNPPEQEGTTTPQEDGNPGETVETGVQTDGELGTSVGGGSDDDNDGGVNDGGNAPVETTTETETSNDGNQVPEDEPKTGSEEPLTNPDEPILGNGGGSVASGESSSIDPNLKLYPEGYIIYNDHDSLTLRKPNGAQEDWPLADLCELVKQGYFLIREQSTTNVSNRRMRAISSINARLLRKTPVQSGVRRAVPFRNIFRPAL